MMSKAEIDEFNRRQIDNRNKKEQEEKMKNMQFANQRGQEISLLDNMTDQQKAELA